MYENSYVTHEVLRSSFLFPEKTLCRMKHTHPEMSYSWLFIISRIVITTTVIQEKNLHEVKDVNVCTVWNPLSYNMRFIIHNMCVYIVGHFYGIDFHGDYIFYLIVYRLFLYTDSLFIISTNGSAYLILNALSTFAISIRNLCIKCYMYHHSVLYINDFTCFVRYDEIKIVNPIQCLLYCYPNLGYLS